MGVSEYDVADLLKKHGLTVATAESCTGGLVSGRIINVPGASDIINVGFVTYSNEAKMEYLGVSDLTLEKHGAVSMQCAKEMAEGAAEHTGSDVGLSTTGIAGPDGGTEEKPVGLVYIGCSIRGKTKVSEHRFKGDRKEVRESAVAAALALLYDHVTDCLTETDK